MTCQQRNDYRLIIRQQPKQARSCGTGDKADRRPLDPPPIIELRIRKPNVKAKRHAGASSSAPNDDADYIQPSAAHPVFMFASLIPEDSEVELYELSGSRNQHVSGTVISSLFHLKDQSCFVFPDLSIRTEGKWRLKMTLYEISESNIVHFCQTVITDVFQVYSSKLFPGMAQSTPLSKAFAQQGLRMRIRRPDKAEDEDGALPADGTVGGSAPAPKKRQSKKRGGPASGPTTIESKKRQREADDLFAQQQDPRYGQSAASTSLGGWDNMAQRAYESYGNYMTSAQQAPLSNYPPPPSSSLSMYDGRGSQQNGSFAYGMPDMMRASTSMPDPRGMPAVGQGGMYNGYYQQQQQYPNAGIPSVPQSSVPRQGGGYVPAQFGQPSYRMSPSQNQGWHVNQVTSGPGAVDPRLSPPHQLAPLRHERLLSDPANGAGNPNDMLAPRGLYGAPDPTADFVPALGRPPSTNSTRNAMIAGPAQGDVTGLLDGRAAPRAESNLRGTNATTADTIAAMDDDQNQHQSIAQWQHHQPDAIVNSVASTAGKPPGSLAMLLGDQQQHEQQHKRHILHGNSNSSSSSHKIGDGEDPVNQLAPAFFGAHGQGSPSTRLMNPS